MQWERTLGLLQEMAQQMLMPIVVSYTAAISACEKGSQREGALGVLHEVVY